MSEHRFSFRPLVDADLPMMYRWLNEPGVIRWWEGEDVSLPAVTAQYGSDREDSATEHWIAELEDEPVGWICCWPVLTGLEESEPWFPLGVEETAAGIDYLIAAPTQRGRGLGSAMIRAFSYNVVFGRHCDFTQVAASPYRSNAASCRALQKAGFRYAGSIDYGDDDPDGPCSLMIMNRPANQSTD